ncbi:MAG: extracellular solute-binding protein [candidate division WOR-3 bacterium]
MRRFLIFIVLAGLMIFSNCARKGTRQANKLVIWESYNDEEHAVFMQIVEKFKAENPGVEIEVQRIPFDGMEQKVLTALASRSAPDIARVDYAFVAKLADKNGILPIEETELADIKDKVMPAALYSNFYRGKFYGLPDQTTCIALFYNKEIFKKKGIKNPPKTWEEFIEVGKKITDGRTYAFGMHNSLWWTFPFFFSYGAKFLSEDGKTCLLDSPEAIAAFSFKVDLYRKYKIEGGAWQSGAINPDAGFRNGKYAMIFNGPWSIKSLQEAKIPFGVALIPAGPAGSATTVGGTNMVIFHKETKELALKFMKFLLTPEIQAFWANELGQIPLRFDALPLIDTIKNPYLPVFIEQMKYATPRPPHPNYSDIELTFNAEMEAALSGQKSPEQALRDAVKKVNEKILREVY